MPYGLDVYGVIGQVEGEAAGRDAAGPQGLSPPALRTLAHSPESEQAGLPAPALGDFKLLLRSSEPHLTIRSRTSVEGRLA